MRRSVLIILLSCGAVLAAAPAAAEEVRSWYGGVDLGYHAPINRPILVSDAECGRRGGRLGPRRGGVGTYCNIPGLVLPVAGRRTPLRSISDFGWLSSDGLAQRFVAACARARGRVATSGEYGYCVPAPAVRR